MSKRAGAFSGLLFVAVAASGCGGTAATPTATPAGSPGTPVAVTLREFSVERSPQEVAAGPITFGVTNAGAIEHEFVVLGPTGLAIDQLPSGDGGQTIDVEEVGEAGDLGKIAAGSGATLNVTLAAGNYVLICNLPTHYTSGMRVAFTVH